MTRHVPPVLLLLALFGLSACGAILEPSPAESTLMARNTDLSTQMADLQNTATVEWDRMMVTLEHAQTEVRSSRDLNAAVQATLVANGTAPAFIDANMPRPLAAQPTIAVDVTGLLGGQNVEGGGPPVTPAGLPPLAPAEFPGAAPAPTATEGPQTGPRLADVVVAADVSNSDGCAIDARTSFASANDNRVYVVATMLEMPRGAAITARWFRQADNANIDTFEWVTDRAYNRECAWFYIEQSGVDFLPGTYSVTMDLNGQTVAGPLAFSIDS